MRNDVEITNFTAGELSPRMKGRIDHKSYYSALDTALNMVVMPQGGMTERPGTIFAELAQDQAAFGRLVRFVYSTLQAYVLEFTDENIRVYKSRGAVMDGPDFVDIAAPYATADLKALKFTQSADTLFIVHPDYPPATLTRSSHVDWTYEALVFRDGPYLDENDTDNQVTPSAATGAITLTWDTTDGINGGAGFTADDIGRAVRVKLFSLWAWCGITAITSNKIVSATVKAKVNDGAAGAIDGADWVATTDYPTGAVAKNGSVYFIAVQGGRSSSANGPNGQGSRILDGTVIWSGISTRDNQAYAHSTFYNTNDVIKNGSNYYQCTVGGKTDSGGGGPTGTGGAITDGTAVFSYLAPFSFPTKTRNWALGAWSGTMGYPRTDRFWQARLNFGGIGTMPSRVDSSQTGDFTNMAPSKADGSVLASNALSWTIDDDQVNAINWLMGAGSAQAMQLGMGTLAGEHILQAASSSQSLSPTSVQAYNETAYGCAENVEPVRIGKALLFVDRTKRKLREWGFNWQVNGYEGPDKLQYSEHITRAPAGADAALGGIAEMAWQQSPHQVIWAILNSGALISFTYDRGQDIFAPCRHQLGGNYYGGAPIVESLCVIPSDDGTYDELWLRVVRTIAGTVTRTIEVMAPYFDGQSKDLAYFVDCGLPPTLTKPATILTVTGLSNANAGTDTLPASFTGTAVLVTGADVFDSGSVGGMIRVNGGRIVVTAQSDARHAAGTVLDGLMHQAPAAADSWSLDVLHDTFDGLDHLAGETVQVWGDGADLGTALVDEDGKIAPGNGGEATVAAAGLFYRPIAVTMPWEPVRAAAAATQGKLKRVDELFVRFHETASAKYGRRVTDPMTDVVEDRLEPMELRQSAQLMDTGNALFSGMRAVKPQGGTDVEGQIIVTRDGAGPLTVIGIFARGNVSGMPGNG